MLNTKNLVVKESDIPSYWVFQYYLNINEKLTGQDIKIKSIWNPEEKTASMCLYVDKKKRCYMFKDFSTGKYGNKINLLQELLDLNYSAAVERMIKDYNHFVKINGKVKIDFKPQSKWEINFIKDRLWNDDDAQYWLKYRIGSTMLLEYNVKPILYYNMIKEESGTISKLKIEGKHIYGFYNKNNKVYKIYQPFKKKHRFHKLKGFGYNIEVIAPDSENTMIKPYIIENLKNKYKKIITLFDNDSAGHKAIERYKEVYKINGTSLSLSKDISDAVSQYEFNIVHKELKPLLKETLNKNI